MSKVIIETMGLITELERRLTDRLDDLEIKIDERVTYKVFTWILGILMTIILGALGLIYTKVDQVDEKAGPTQNAVSRIAGQLIGADITK